MIINYKGESYTYPNSLNEVTLRQRIEYEKTYGKEHARRLEEILKTTEGEDREMEMYFLQIDIAVESFSFFTKIPLSEVKDNFSLKEIMNVYYASLSLITEAYQDIDIREHYDYKGKKYYLEPPEISPESEITFNQFLTAKEVLRQMQALGKGNFEALPYIAAIYLREKGEAFCEKGLEERAEYFMDLPLDMALSVSFFLSSTLSLYTKTFRALQAEERGK